MAEEKWLDVGPVEELRARALTPVRAGATPIALVYRDGTFGPIYFIRYSRHNGWNEKNTAYPFYTTSPDQRFKRACEALLADKPMTLQWWEGDRAKDGFYPEIGETALKATPTSAAPR